MDSAHLANLFSTGEFSDCSVLSSDGETFKAHRFIFSPYPRLKELIAPDRKIDMIITPVRTVHLNEPKEVVKRMLGWLYGTNWAPQSVGANSTGIGKALTEIMSLCDAAKKYEIPKLEDDAYAVVGHLFSQITDGETGLHVLRDLTDKTSSEGALQRTLIDRLLVLLPKELPPKSPTRKRKRSSSQKPACNVGQISEEATTVVKPPERNRRPTLKVSLNEESASDAGNLASEKKSTLKQPQKKFTNLHPSKEGGKPQVSRSPTTRVKR